MRTDPKDVLLSAACGDLWVCRLCVTTAARQRGACDTETGEQKGGVDGAASRRGACDTAEVGESRLDTLPRRSAALPLGETLAEGVRVSAAPACPVRRTTRQDAHSRAWAQLRRPIFTGPEVVTLRPPAMRDSARVPIARCRLEMWGDSHALRLALRIEARACRQVSPEG